MMEELRDKIESLVAELDGSVEVIAVERSGPEALRIFIDHPSGVDLALCERVSNQLRSLSADWALEVSSPGLDRPLTKAEHYRRFVGSRLRLRTAEALDGRKRFTGRLAEAGEAEILVETPDGAHRIPLTLVERCNLVPEYAEVSQ